MGKYLKFYQACVSNGDIMPEEGLCMSLFGSDDLHPKLAFFEPTKEERDEYDHLRGYWGDEFGALSTPGKFKRLNDFRKNVVLLLAAKNGEL